MQQDQNCYGQLYPPYQAGLATYTSSDLSVCNPGFSTGTTTGVGPGEALVNGAWMGDKWLFTPTGDCDYTPEEVVREAICDILTRRVDSVSPERALIGQPVDVTISGSGFGTGTPTINAGSGITVSNVELINSGEVRARFTIATNAPGGNHAVTVTTSLGQTTTISGNFVVQVPISLEVTFAGLSSLPNGCPSDRPFGTRLRLRYQVRDQSGNAIATTIPIREDLTNLTILGVQNPDFNIFNDLVTPSGNTDGDGSFVDNPIGVCSQPPAFPSGTRATFRQRLFALIGSTAFNVRINDFSISLRSDCGDGRNGSDIDVENCP